MPGQAIVTIRDKQWTCSVANTYTELATGLSGVPSIPAGTGMLFDLSVDYQTIQIDMTRMLFPLDIIFINSTQGVVGVMHNVQPSETDVRLQNEQLPGARCFLEVNAGEAAGIEVGDSVNIQGYAQPAQLNIGSLIGIIGIVAMGIIMFKALLEPKERPKLPPAPPRAEEELQERKLALEDKGREIAREAGVEFLKLAEGWQARYAIPRYWFKDDKGKEIIATDLEELKWKLGRLARLPQTQARLFKPGEIVLYKGERVRVSEQIGDRVNIFIPSRRELIWVKPEALTKAKVYFIGSCKISEGHCLTHDYSVSEKVKCPQSPLTDEEWQAAFELVKTAFPEGQPNPWVNGWWPETLEEAERAVKRYADSLWNAFRKYEAMAHEAVARFARSRDKAIYYYRHYVMREYERGKEEALLPQTVSNPSRLDGLEIVKAYKQISRHGEDKISVSMEAWAIFPRGRRPHFISMYRSGDEYVIQPLYGHVEHWVRVPVAKVKVWIKSLPVRHFEPMAVAPHLRKEAERLAIEVDEPLAIIPLPSKEPESPQTQQRKTPRELFEAREFHRLTRGEMLRLAREATLREGFTWDKASEERTARLHRQTVEIALREGVPVPDAVLGDYPELKRPSHGTGRLIPIEKRPRRETDLEYLADSPEFLAQTIEDIGYRGKLDTAFQEAIARAKGLK